VHVSPNRVKKTDSSFLQIKLSSIAKGGDDAAEDQLVRACRKSFAGMREKGQQHGGGTHARIKSLREMNDLQLAGYPNCFYFGRPACKNDGHGVESEVQPKASVRDGLRGGKIKTESHE